MALSLATPPPSRVEWVLATLAGLGTLGLLGFASRAVPVFRQLFEDFGGPQPPLTALVLTPGLLPGMAALGSAAVVAAFFAPLSRPWRRLLLGGAVLLPVVGVALFQLGVSLPLAALQEAVQ